MPYAVPPKHVIGAYLERSECLQRKVGAILGKREVGFGESKIGFGESMIGFGQMSGCS